MFYGGIKGLIHIFRLREEEKLLSWFALESSSNLGIFFCNNKIPLLVSITIQVSFPVLLFSSSET